MERHYEITPKTIIIGLIAVASIWLAIQLSSVISSLFIALVLSLALDPFVTRLKSWKIPRPLGVFLVFFTVVSVVGGLLVYGFTPLTTETGKFILQLPDFLRPLLDRLGPVPFTDDLQRQIVSQSTIFSANVLSFTAAAVSNFLFILTTLVFTFYLLLDWENLKKSFVGLLNSRAQGRVQGIIDAMEHRLGGWLRGQVVLMLVVGVVVYLGLFALGVEYALPLAVIAGLLEIVPVIGPIVSAIPALIVGFGTSLWLGVWVLVLYVIVQQLENSLIVPSVMSRAVGFSPLATLLFIFVGGQLFGVGGALLAIPAALFLSIIAKDLLNWNPAKRQ